MRSGQPSKTADYVAALRGLGPLLPREAQLVDDPLGAQWTGYDWLRQWSQRAPRVSRVLALPARKWLLYMQVRTFTLDEEVRQFARSGGSQLVLLGAGLDARAARLEKLHLRVFEVDHPDTQAKKGEFLGDKASFVAWDFERRPLHELPAQLAELGYVRTAPSCVLWEGVSMYLSEDAIEQTFSMLKELLAPGSVVAFTYFSLERLRSRRLRERFFRHFVARGGEPFRFGWEPGTLPAWLSARGFALERDDTMGVLAKRWLPERFAAFLEGDLRRIAVATRRR
jgi:methyltransferase (TIGR00027 family)